MSSWSRLALVVFALELFGAGELHAQSFRPAGELVEGSGRGRRDSKIYVPGMGFPLDTPAYANSQVYGNGGYLGPRGTAQCDAVNYSFPWRDTYCETRGHAMPLCPAGRGHQGNDIRPSTCRNNHHSAYAVADGKVTHVGSWSLYMRDSDGVQYEYLHMSRMIARRSRVECGRTVVGKVSNRMGRTATTIHLHFNIRMAVRGVGFVFVPPYTSLVDAYGRSGGPNACGGSPIDAGMPDAMPMMDAGPPDTGPPGGCYSTTLSRHVEDGVCVQGTRGGCGLDSCTTYQCVEGAWQCPGTSACTETHENEACSTPEPGEARCRSTLLGRMVDHGTCVQVDGRARPDENNPACADGCGWYRCEDGIWNCSEPSQCTAEEHPFAACQESGMGCMSATLGAPVDHGDCVQVAEAACGETCGWYQCGEGAWSCADVADCGRRTFENASCAGMIDPCEMHSDCGACNEDAGCGWCASSGLCVSDTRRSTCAAESWHDTPSACTECGSYDSCAPCATNGHCVWCQSSGSCIADEGPAMCAAESRIPNPGSCP